MIPWFLSTLFARPLYSLSLSNTMLRKSPILRPLLQLLCPPVCIQSRPLNPILVPPLKSLIPPLPEQNKLFSLSPHFPHTAQCFPVLLRQAHLQASPVLQSASSHDISSFFAPQLLDIIFADECARPVEVDNDESDRRRSGLRGRVHQEGDCALEFVE